MTGAPIAILVTLDPATRALVRLAAAVATGAGEVVRTEARAALAAGVAPIWGDELLLQSVLMVGYPRALSAAAIWREAVGAPAAFAEDGTDPGLAPEWRRRGEVTCRTVYGVNYHRLRENVAALHPALDAWMVTEGYGRTLSRPGLDLARRELCVVGQVLVQGAERQLHSHLRGARHAGAADSVIAAALEAAAPFAPPAAVAMGTTLWERIRQS